MQDTSAESFGRGLNSIPVRFALMSFVLSLACIAVSGYYLPDNASHLSVADAAIIGAFSIGPALVTFLAATKLTKSILALRQSTEAIASGLMTKPVEVDCACEVGGLADSFRKMVNRLNSSVTRMNFLAHTDPVTGLPNRSVITHVLQLATELSNERPCSGSLVFIDLDNFKAVNDTHGHEAGDELLRLVSERIITDGFQRSRSSMLNCANSFGELLQACPEDIVLSRFAGDEFVALIPGATPTEALRRIAERILESLAQPFQINGAVVVVGASIGIAQTPEDTLVPNDLLGLADFAMYQAKQQGKNCYVFFDQNLKSLAEAKRRLELEFRDALNRDELILHYQPKLDFSAKLIGVEALVRWNHPHRGILAPGIFIPLAEEARLMKELGQRVVDLAIAQCREWCDMGLRTPIAINFSPAQFESDRCFANLLESIEKARIDPGLIEVEITETMAMSDFNAAYERIHRLREAGVKTSIDDFGIGFSNLCQLSKLPVSTIKIDQSLVREIGDRRNEAIIRAVIDMAHSLGNSVVAEGVESFDQIEFLEKAGCDALQGFYFARPMAPAQLLEWLDMAAALPQPVGRLARSNAA